MRKPPQFVMRPMVRVAQQPNVVPVGRTIPIQQETHGAQLPIVRRPLREAAYSIFGRPVMVPDAVAERPITGILPPPQASTGPQADVPTPIMPVVPGPGEVATTQIVPIGVRSGVAVATSVFGGQVYAEDALDPNRVGVHGFRGFRGPDGIF